MPRTADDSWDITQSVGATGLSVAAARAAETARRRAYLEEPTNVAEWLRLRGWDVSVAESDELLTHYQRTVDDDVADAMPASPFITARRPPRDIVSDAAEGVS